MKTNIVIAGHICVDFIPLIENHFDSTDQIVVSGGLTNVGKIVISGGGLAFNVSNALSKIVNRKKFNLLLNAKTGDDFISEILEKKLIENKIPYTINKDKKLETSYTIAIATPKIDRAYLHNPGANNSFSLKDLSFPKKGIPGIFHLGYPQLMKKMYDNENGLRNMLKIAKDKKYTTSIDMSLVSPHSESAKKDWNMIMKNALPYADIIFLGLEEAHFILNTKNYFKIKEKYTRERKDISSFYTIKRIDEMIQNLFNLGASLIILKLGKKGSSIFSKIYYNHFSNLTWNNLSLIKKQNKIKDIKNSIGAGDNFVAGFIYSYLNGESPSSCLDNATHVATRSLLNYSAEL